MTVTEFAYRTYFETDPDDRLRAAVMRLSGTVDLDTGRDLAAALHLCTTLRPTAILVDITEVVLMDCAGLRVLLTARDEASREGIPLTLTGTPQPAVGMLLNHISNLPAPLLRTLHSAPRTDTAPRTGHGSGVGASGKGTSDQRRGIRQPIRRAARERQVPPPPPPGSTAPADTVDRPDRRRLSRFRLALTVLASLTTICALLVVIPG